MTKTPLRTTFDHHAHGRQAGYVRLMNSTNDSPGGWVQVPLITLRGDGQ